MSKPEASLADNPTQGLVPLSVTPLCTGRMNGWHQVVQNLIKYLSVVVGKRHRLNVSEQEKRMSESNQKTAQALGAAFSNDNGFFSDA